MSLYFPDHDEQQAMAVNCVRTNGGSCDRMSDPSKRAFVTEHGKELTLYPDSMSLSGAGGKISLVDDRGLDIIFEHGILIMGRSVKFEAPTVTIAAKESEIGLMTGPNPLMLFTNPQAWMPAAGFLLSNQFDLLAHSHTGVVGSETQEYEPYTDKPQEVNFWADFAFGVLAGLAKIALVVAAVAAAGALTAILGPVGFVLAATAAGAITGGLAGFAYALKSGKSIGEALLCGLGGAILGATIGFCGGYLALVPGAYAPAMVVICGTSMQQGEKIGKGIAITQESILRDAAVNTLLVPFFLNPVTQIPALLGSGGFCAYNFVDAWCKGDGERAGESLVGAAASFLGARKAWQAKQAALEAAKQPEIEEPTAEQAANEAGKAVKKETALSDECRYGDLAREGKVTVEKGSSRPPNTSTPNSIYEQIRPDGTVQCRAFYNEDGLQFCRQDFCHTHFDKETGTLYNGPHTHYYTFNLAGLKDGSFVGPVFTEFTNLPYD